MFDRGLPYDVPVTLRAFSVRQPWAGLLAAGVKRYEVRTWRPRELGLYCVHASSGKAAGIRELREEPLFQRALHLAGMEDEAGWVQGALLAVVEVARIWEPGAAPRRLTKLDEFLCRTTADVYLWEVRERWVFARPIPCQGALNLWTTPARVRRALTRQVSTLRIPISAE